MHQLFGLCMKNNLNRNARLALEVSEQTHDYMYIYIYIFIYFFQNCLPKSPLQTSLPNPQPRPLHHRRLAPSPGHPGPVAVPVGGRAPGPAAPLTYPAAARGRRRPPPPPPPEATPRRSWLPHHRVSTAPPAQKGRTIESPQPRWARRAARGRAEGSRALSGAAQRAVRGVRLVKVVLIFVARQQLWRCHLIKNTPAFPSCSVFVSCSVCTLKNKRGPKSGCTHGTLSLSLNSPEPPRQVSLLSSVTYRCLSVGKKETFMASFGGKTLLSSQKWFLGRTSEIIIPKQAHMRRGSFRFVLLLCLFQALPHLTEID